MKQFFKSGDKVVCKERHPDSSIYVSWNPRMDKIVGVTGVVVDCTDHYVRVDFGGKYETLIFTMDPKWLQRVDKTDSFKIGDIVACCEIHAGEAPGPGWHPDMDKFVGVTGVVSEISKHIKVKFDEPFEASWCYAPTWLKHVQKTQEEMTSRADTAKATETFTTTWSLDITLTDGKVTAVNVHPPAPPEPQKPKFAVGDIVVCKKKPREMPYGYEWTDKMTLMLNIPGRAMYVVDVDGKSKIVSVEFGGCQTRFAYPEECLEHETSEMAVAMKQLFARLDKEKNTICIGRSDTKFI